MLYVSKLLHKADDESMDFFVRALSDFFHGSHAGSRKQADPVTDLDEEGVSRTGVVGDSLKQVDAAVERSNEMLREQGKTSQFPNPQDLAQKSYGLIAIHAIQRALPKMLQGKQRTEAIKDLLTGLSLKVISPTFTESVRPNEEPLVLLKFFIRATENFVKDWFKHWMFEHREFSFDGPVSDDDEAESGAASLEDSDQDFNPDSAMQNSPDEMVDRFDSLAWHILKYAPPEKAGIYSQILDMIAKQSVPNITQLAKMMGAKRSEVDTACQGMLRVFGRIIRDPSVDQATRDQLSFILRASQMPKSTPSSGANIQMKTKAQRRINEINNELYTMNLMLNSAKKQNNSGDIAYYQKKVDSLTAELAEQEKILTGAAEAPVEEEASVVE